MEGQPDATWAHTVSMETTGAKAELLLAALAAYQAGNDETLRGLLHPEIETYSEPGLINSGSFTGFKGFQHWARQWEEAWEQTRFQPLEFIDVDESHLVARVRVVGRGAGSGLEVDREFGYLYEVRDGRATRFHVYENVGKALEATHRLVSERR